MKAKPFTGTVMGKANLKHTLLLNSTNLTSDLFVRAVAGITHSAKWKNQRIVTVGQARILGMSPRVADAVECLHQHF